MGSSERAILSFPSVVISSSFGTLYIQLGRVVQTAGESCTDSWGEFYRQLGRVLQTARENGENRYIFGRPGEARGFSINTVVIKSLNAAEP